MKNPLATFMARLRQWFSAPAEQKPNEAESIRIGEGIHGTFSYHLHVEGTHQALCGTQIMRTSIPLESWGVITHLCERYCEKCMTEQRERFQKNLILPSGKQ
jgi:hypothetical protein